MIARTYMDLAAHEVQKDASGRHTRICTSTWEWALLRPERMCANSFFRKSRTYVVPCVGIFR